MLNVLPPILDEIEVDKLASAIDLVYASDEIDELNLVDKLASAIDLVYASDEIDELNLVDKLASAEILSDISWLIASPPTSPIAVDKESSTSIARLTSELNSIDKLVIPSSVEKLSTKSL